jgi:hypothetical protein
MLRDRELGSKVIRAVHQFLSLIVKGESRRKEKRGGRRSKRRGHTTTPFL